MNRDTLIQLIASGLLAVCVVLSGALSTSVVAEAGRAQLVYTDEAAEGDPPEIALGIAMGAFRGLFVNYLWIRANKLKEEGKFFEAIQLSSAITRLQPRFPRVWAFHAWNMAYNISVATNTAAERWQWVNAGIKLLRDEGIPRNPNDVLLHKELAWTFIHKVQGFSDDANHYYKRELAKEWTILLGSPPKLEGTTKENSERMAAFLAPVASAPDTLEGVIEEELRAKAPPGAPPPAPPGAGGADVQHPSMVKELADRVRNEAGLPLGRDLLFFVEMRAAWINAWYVKESAGDLAAASHNAIVDELMQDTRYEDAWPRLLAFARKRVIIDEMHMEPERMLRYTRKYGPLDWRHAATHAIYWSARGVEEGLERLGTTQFDTLNTDRITLHAIQELCRFGQIQYDLLSNEYFALNDFDWVDEYSDLLENELKPRGGIAASEERAYSLYGAGYENLLKDFMRAAYTRGDIARAERYHERLRKYKGLNLNDPSLVDDLQLPLKDFVDKIVKDRISTPSIALSEIESALIEAYLRGLGQRRPEVFRRQMEYADKAYKAYLQVQNITTTADPESTRMKGFVGETFGEIASRVLVRLLAGGGFGEFNLGPYQAGAIYRRTPVNLQRLIYDELAGQVLRTTPWMNKERLSELFPEPPGLAEFRAQMSKLESESDRAKRRAIEFQKQ